MMTPFVLLSVCAWALLSVALMSAAIVMNLLATLEDMVSVADGVRGDFIDMLL